MRIRPARRSAARVPAAPVAGTALLALFAAVLLSTISPPKGLSLAIAQAGSGPRLPAPDAAIVAVLADGSLLLDGESVTISGLRGKIEAGGRDRPVVVGTTDESPYGAVAAVLDALASLPPGRGGGARVLLPTHAEIADQAKLLGRDPFAPPAGAR